MFLFGFDRNAPGKDIRRRGNRRISPPRFAVEDLEARRLLATDSILPALASSHPADAQLTAANPFMAGSRNLDALVKRVSEQPYVPGQLIVARDIGSFEESRLSDSSRLNWNAKGDLDSEATVKTLLRHQTTDGSRLELLQLEFNEEEDIDAVMRALNKDPDILWSSPNFIYEQSDPREFVPGDPQYASQSHHQFMQNELAWDVTLGDPSVIVAITDDGVSLTHDDLQNNIWANPFEIPNDGLDNDNNGYVDDVHGWDFIQNDNNPNPSLSDNHGTHVAGIVAGEIDNNKGIAGVAGHTKIMPIKFYDGQNPTAWTSTVILAAMQYAVDNGAKIINTSYNIDGFAGDPTVASAFQYIHDHGRLHFNSAGNGNHFNPARQVFEQTLLVASTETGNSKNSYSQAGDVRSGSSNYGLGIDLAAPGGSILSTVPGNNYLAFSGTSMAAPNAAGVAALIWSTNPTWTRDQVAAQLLATADNIDSFNPRFAGYLGTGRVNSYRALTEAPSAPKVKALYGLPMGQAPRDPAITSFSLAFTQLMDATSVRDVANYELRYAGLDDLLDTSDDVLLPLSNTNSNYYVGTNLLKFKIDSGPLEYGRYRLSLLDNGVRSFFNSALDGDVDGNPGGAYRHEFTVTIKDFLDLNPVGGIAAMSKSNIGTLSQVGEVDLFPIRAETGESYSVLVTPTSSTVTLSVLVPGNMVPFVAPSPGQPVVVPSQVVSVTGDQKISILGDEIGDYRVDVYKNVSTDDFSEGLLHSVDMSQLATSGRASILAKSSGSQGVPYFQHYNAPARFVDIASTGTPLTLSHDAATTITTTIGNSFFASGAVRVGNNGGLIRSPFGNLGGTNTALPSTAFGSALFPFWDDLGDDSGGVYWQQTTIEGNDALVVQWHERPHYGELGGVGSTTFQVQVFATGSVLARFAYQDVDFGDERYDGGLSATIGYQTSAVVGAAFSMNSSSLIDGDVIDIYLSDPTIDVDEFSLDLTGYAGRRFDIVLDGQGASNFATSTMELLDPSETVVAAAAANPNGQLASNADLAITGFTIPVGGVYKLRTSLNQDGDYAILISDNVFGLKPTSLATPLSLLDRTGAIGHLGSSDIRFTKRHDPSKFVDISATGTPLNLQDDGEISLQTNIGNAMFPAGAVTVANNGGLLSGNGRTLSSANVLLPTNEIVRALLPYWDDLDDDTGNVFWQETVLESVPALVVQWDNRPRYTPNGALGSATFQIQVFSSGPVAARFAYADVTFGDSAYDDGRSATIGYQADFQFASTFSQNTTSIKDGDYIELAYANPDYYTLHLDAGQGIILQTKTPFDHLGNLPRNSLNPYLSILEATGENAMIVSDANSQGGKNARIEFTAPATGDYLVRVGSEGGSGEYTLRIAPVISEIDGDFDDDSVFGCLDIDALTQAIVSGGAVDDYDLNSDDTLTPADVLLWLTQAGERNLGPGRSYLVGDADLDGNVDGSDFALWNAAKFTATASWCNGDFDTNGFVDGSDFGLWNVNKFTSA
jgi:subtilisin family serine protease